MDNNESELVILNKLPEKIRFLLEKEQIESTHDILTRLEKLRNKGLTADEIRFIQLEAVRGTIPFYSVKEVLDNPIKWKRLSFGCKNLDNCTNGGVLTRGITEICGEAGSGKTQILLQLSLMVQLPEHYGGLNKKAVFICTEQKFPSKRLFQLISVFKKKYPSCHNIEYSSNIILTHLLYAHQLLEVARTTIRNFAKAGIGLIVIDSVAAVFRTEQNYIKRATELRIFVRDLLALSDEYHCAVVCVNQMSSIINDKVKGKVLRQSLGVSWSNLVRTRIKISKKPLKRCADRNCDENLSNLKECEIMFTPNGERRKCNFLITPAGVIDP